MTIILLVQMAYFQRFSSVLRNMFQDSAYNLFVQLEENITIQADSIIQAANNIAYNSYVQDFMGSTNYTRRATQAKIIQDIFEFSAIANPDIRDIILVDHLGQIIRYSGSSEWNTVNYVIENYPAEDLKDSGFGEFYLIDSGEISLYLYAYAFPSYRTPGNTQLCYILFENDSYQRIIENTTLPNSAIFYLLDRDNRILASHDSALNGTYASGEILDLVASNQSQSVVTFEKEQCLLNYSRIPKMAWTLVNVIQQKELEKPLAPLKSFGLVLGFLSLLILLALCVSIIRNIARPLGELSAFLSGVDYETLKKRLKSTGNNEIDHVIGKINTMMEQIQELTHRIFTTQQQFYEMELSKKQAEFHALQNQINPHFLYNTLDCIRSIAYSYQAPEIVSISTSMSKIFRYCIRDTQTVLVREELESIDHYINIIQIRYGNRFIIEKQIDPKLLDLTMIKFILQPLIENAVYHGLELKLGAGILRIVGSYCNENDFYFEVYDTGAGIAPEKLQQINAGLTAPVSESAESSHTGVGLYNINKRIKGAYGDAYGLSVESVRGEWTLVKILLKKLE